MQKWWSDGLNHRIIDTIIFIWTTSKYLATKHRTLSQNSKCCIHCRKLSMPWQSATCPQCIKNESVCPDTRKFVNINRIFFFCILLKNWSKIVTTCYNIRSLWHTAHGRALFCHTEIAMHPKLQFSCLLHFVRAHKP